MNFRVRRSHGWWVLTWTNPLTTECVTENLPSIGDVIHRVDNLLRSFAIEAPSVFIDPTLKEPAK